MTDAELRKATYLVRDVVSALKVAAREFPQRKGLVSAEVKVGRMHVEAESLLKSLEAKNAD